MRHGHRDANHALVLGELEDRGFSVEDTADLGGGFGDAVIGKDDETYILEIKNPAKQGKKEKKYEVRQRQKRERWRGAPWILAFEVEDVLKVHRQRGHVA